MKLKLLIGFLMLTNFVQAQIKTEETAWLARQVHVIESVDGEDFSDLQFLKKELKGKRLVQLGESSHGIGDYYKLKGRLVRFLHQEMGFTVLAIEGGFGDINAAYFDIADASAEELSNRTVFGNFNCQEMLETFHYIKEQNKGSSPLHLAGFDCQESAVYFKPFLSRFLSTHEEALSQRFEEGYFSTFDLYAISRDSAQIMSAIESNRKLLKEVDQFIRKNNDDLQKVHGTSILKIISQTIYNKIRYWEFTFEEIQQFKGFTLRDQLMAENIKWLKDSLYPDQKIIVWAHNAHIHKGATSYTDPEGNPVKMMGAHLEEAFGKENYALGIYSYSGETYRHFKRDVIDFENNSEGSLEARFNELKTAINFLSLQDLERERGTDWLFLPLTVFELENGGQVHWDDFTRRFDGTIVLKKVKAPQY